RRDVRGRAPRALQADRAPRAQVARPRGPHGRAVPAARPEDHVPPRADRPHHASQMTRHQRTKRILAIDPTTKGFGWVVVEAHPLRLVDWGLRACGNKPTARKQALRAIIDRYEPTTLALHEDRQRP